VDLLSSYCEKVTSVMCSNDMLYLWLKLFYGGGKNVMFYSIYKWLV
jgi:hypothetical protein